MIRNDAEYSEAAKRLEDEKARLKEQRKRLKGEGFSASELKRLMDPMLSFHDQLKEEVATYERLKRGEFFVIKNFHGVGALLIALRIAQGISQRELAERLGVHESQVSRDERNEYHKITFERAERILEALEVETTTSVATVGKRSYPVESSGQLRR